MPEQSESLTSEQELAILRQQNKELIERNKALELLTRIDELTGLGNYRGFTETMHREIVGAIRKGKTVSLILMDIDNFKDFNFSNGHSAGNLALQNVATAVKTGIRETDEAYRYGGEEIVVILPDTALNSAIGVSERLRRAREAAPIEVNDKQLKVTTSMGVGSFIPSSPNIQKTPGEINQIINKLINDADTAMYAAKVAGRNRTGFTNPRGQVGVLEAISANPPKMAAAYQKKA